MALIITGWLFKLYAHDTMRVIVKRMKIDYCNWVLLSKIKMILYTMNTSPQKQKSV